MMNGAPPLAKILIYQASLSFLKGACKTHMLRMTVDDHIASMTSNGVVEAIVKSLECRKRILELSTKLELADDPKFRIALRTDEGRIATLLVFILNSKSDEETVLRLEGDSAQYFLDVVQETLDRGFMMAQEHNRMALRIIRKLSERCDRLPSSLFIVGVTGRDEHPSFGGGFGDIYRALYGDQRVALKRMRYFIRGSDLRRIRLKFCREALLWKDLQHAHILPFLGIDRDTFPSSLCMVSPWMEHGTVTNYLKTHGYRNVDKLLYQVSQGLEYLHSRNIVHGDLRGANILIKEDWSACLTDFGLSIFSDATSTMSTNRGGSLYWMAPELLDPGRFGLKFARTPATDVYAFGCVCFELYAERPPFSNLPEPGALMKVLNGERPARPSGLRTMSDTLWRAEDGLGSSARTSPSQHTIRAVCTIDTSSRPPGTNFDQSDIRFTLLNSVKAVAAAATSSSEGPMTATSTHTPPPPPREGQWWRGKPLDALRNIFPSKIPAGRASPNRSTIDLNQAESRSSAGKDPVLDATPKGGTAGSKASGENAGSYRYKAKSLYAYNASPDDSNEISFRKGEIFDIVSGRGGWWQVRNADGSVGSTSHPPPLLNVHALRLVYFYAFSRTFQLSPDYSSSGGPCAPAPKPSREQSCAPAPKPSWEQSNSRSSPCTRRRHTISSQSSVFLRRFSRRSRRDIVPQGRHTRYSRQTREVVAGQRPRWVGGPCTVQLSPAYLSFSLIYIHFLATESSS
ncbi:hypothetical protein DFH08DRAFT_1077723 [Mycena albidolilacea]|uniref:mitogen-activated protein kinase kinase kinase n=1 Tax=Mycena albidolilacea TaxID=1033008 RepID=A0AAD7EWH6_9AGAR|nr:hypothetical protein DFH08DRAFT_1077723 [Mycena albidolilacea]